MLSHRDQLLCLAPPPISPVCAGTPEDWEAVERSLGTGLPSDYKWLVNTYGFGDFCDMLVILNPFVESDVANLLRQFEPMTEIYLDCRESFPERCELPAFPAPAGLIPFAFDLNGGDLFWSASGPPDEWPIVHYNWRGGCLRQDHRMPLVAFLVEWISGRLPDSFFGAANAPEIIRKDPVFSPADTSP